MMKLSQADRFSIEFKKIVCKEHEKPITLILLPDKAEDETTFGCAYCKQPENVKILSLFDFC